MKIQTVTGHNIELKSIGLIRLKQTREGFLAIVFPPATSPTFADWPDTSAMELNVTPDEAKRIVRAAPHLVAQPYASELTKNHAFER